MRPPRTPGRDRDPNGGIETPPQGDDAKPSPKQEARDRRQIRQIEALPPEGRFREGLRLLDGWKAEARRRANDLDEPGVWMLMKTKARVIAACDPAGELASELSRICHEALARVFGPHLMGGSRPVADRSRLQVRAR